jgi:hypothetical protein
VRSALAAMALAGLAACDSSCSSVPAAPCASPTSADDQCILPHMASDVAAGESWAEALLDVQAKCGSSPQEIEQTWAAYESANVTLGLPVPMPIADGGH